MKRKPAFITLVAILVFTFVFSTGKTMAAWSAKGDTVNIITIGSVRAQIVEEYVQGQKLYPGSEVNKKVQVTNTGNVDSVIRVKISKAWGDSRDENGNLIINNDLPTDNILIDFDTENWYYNEEDGYFYYKSVLLPEQTTLPLFEGFTVNKDSGNIYKNKEADIIVHMESIQAGGNAVSTWGITLEDLGIVYNKGDGTNIITTVQFISPEAKFAFTVNEGDLFANFKNLVPGEGRTQTVEVSNNWDNSVGIFISAEYIDQTQATDKTKELIDKLLKEYATIVITDSLGRIVYNGPVWGNPNVDTIGTDSMKNPISLGDFTPDEVKALTVSLSLDPRTTDEQRGLLAYIKWAFYAQGADEQPTTTTSTTTTTTQPTTTASTTAQQTQTTTVAGTQPATTVKSTVTGKSSGGSTYTGSDITPSGSNGKGSIVSTGDIDIVFYEVLMGVSAVSILLLFITARRRLKEQASG